MLISQNPSKGLIFNIGRYAIHDGPGIRTTVFLKGCPGSCLWCSTPESQSQYPEPVRSTGKIETVGRWVSPKELFGEVERDRPFWRRSGGGITLSGGEPLIQPRFVSEFLDLCKSKYIHTAIESCLYCKAETLEGLLDLIDYVQFDIKEMDPEKHQKLTGMHNQVILNNAAMILKSPKPSLVRIPLVPGCNDGEENFRALGRFLADSRPGVDLEILSYHRMGVGRYEDLGKTYSLPDTQPPTDSELRRAIEILREYPIRVICKGVEINEEQQ